MASGDFYHSKQWKRKREQILRRDGYLCREMLRYGQRVEATTVHHIWPLEDHPEYALEDWNLLSLSDGANNKMHDRKTGKLTELGEWWKRHTPPPKRLGRKGYRTGEGKFFQ